MPEVETKLGGRQIQDHDIQVPQSRQLEGHNQAAVHKAPVGISPPGFVAACTPSVRMWNEYGALFNMSGHRSRISRLKYSRPICQLSSVLDEWAGSQPKMGCVPRGLWRSGWWKCFRNTMDTVFTALSASVFSSVCTGIPTCGRGKQSWPCLHSYLIGACVCHV